MNHKVTGKKKKLSNVASVQPLSLFEYTMILLKNNHMIIFENKVDIPEILNLSPRV